MAKRQAKQRYVVARTEELPPGQRRIVTVRGREIGVFNVGGEYFLLLNYCPHRFAPLCLGRLRPLVTSADVPQVGHERENEILKCPWHQYEFDIRTGKALFDPKLAVRTYEAKQEQDQVVIYL